MDSSGKSQNWEFTKWFDDESNEPQQQWEATVSAVWDVVYISVEFLVALPNTGGVAATPVWTLIQSLFTVIKKPGESSSASTVQQKVYIYRRHPPRHPTTSIFLPSSDRRVDTQLAT